MSLQVPDWITFRGRHRQLLSHPLDAYLRGLPDRPDFRLRGSGQDRGYVASWEVRADDSLWLTGLTTRPDGDGPDPGTGLVFPDPGPVAAAWVTQCLRSPDTEQRRYSPVGYETTYARESYLSVWHGRLVAVEEMDGKTARRIGGELTPHLDAVFGAEESAFLRAAFADPDDEAPRLVYADWLDERHDPRGGYVRRAERIGRLGRDPTPEEFQEFAAHRDAANQGDWLWRRLLGYGRLDSALWWGEMKLRGI